MAVIMIISTVSFIMLATTSSLAFAQNKCVAHDNAAACAQSDLSLPVPSENDIAASGVQQQPEDESQHSDAGSGGSVDNSDDNSFSNDAGAFLLPFP